MASGAIRPIAEALKKAPEDKEISGALVREFGSRLNLIVKGTLGINLVNLLYIADATRVYLTEELGGSEKEPARSASASA